MTLSMIWANGERALKINCGTGSDSKYSFSLHTFIAQYSDSQSKVVFTFWVKSLEVDKKNKLQHHFFAIFAHLPGL